jgi:hypothetical protein
LRPSLSFATEANMAPKKHPAVMESSRYKDWGRRHEGPIWIMTETKEKKKRKQLNVVSSLSTDKLH